MSGKRNWGDNMTNRMDGHAPPLESDEWRKLPSKIWKKHYECKKTKGTHSWEFQSVDFYRWSGSWVAKWRCGACGKNEHEYRSTKRKFDAFRNTIYAGLGGVDNSIALPAIGGSIL